MSTASRVVLSLDLKIWRDRESLISEGRLFHCLIASRRKDFFETLGSAFDGAHVAGGPMMEHTINVAWKYNLT